MNNDNDDHDDSSARSSASTRPLLLVFAWLAVGVPLLWGVLQSVSKAAALFH